MLGIPPARLALALSIASYGAGCECGEPPPAVEAPEVADPVEASRLAPDGALSVGSGHACVARGGRALCWGDNSAGQLGDGTTTSRGEAGAVTGLDAVAGVAAGDELGCAWREDGSARCWGHSGSDRREDVRPTPRPVRGLADVTSIAIAPESTQACAIHGGGRVSCFGYGAWGADDGAAPVAVAGIEDAARLAIHGELGCAITRAGRVACWRFEDDAAPRAAVTQLASVERLAMDPMGHALIVIDGTVRRWTPPTGTPQPIAGLADVIDVSAGHGYDCALDRAGTVRCWADADRVGPGPFGAAPEAVGELADASAISGYGGSRCALSGDRVRCWGAADLWIPDPFLEATEVPEIEDAEELGAGGFVTCVRHADGGVSCWGSSTEGALGREGPDEVFTPRRIAERDVERLHVESDLQVCLEDRTGAMRCLGRIPDGRTEPVADATIVPAFARPDELLLDGNGACVRRGGSWRCHEAIATTPEMARYDLVLATMFGSCGVRDEQLTCWTGGEATATGRYEPSNGYVRPTPLGRPDAIAMSEPGAGKTVCALFTRSTPSVQCWTLDGEVGPVEPVAVPGLDGARAMALVTGRVCAIVDDDNVRCVPFEDFPELSFGAPHEVRGTDGATSLAAGYGHACALLRGGRVACFGSLHRRGDGSPGYQVDSVAVALP